MPKKPPKPLKKQEARKMSVQKTMEQVAQIDNPRLFKICARTQPLNVKIELYRRLIQEHKGASPEQRPIIEDKLAYLRFYVKDHIPL